MIIKRKTEQTKLKIDFHSHILPAIDDGSQSIAQSMQFLAAAKNAEFETIIATSHFYPHRYNVPEFLRNRDAAFAKIDQSADIPHIICGAEVLVCEGIEDMIYIESLCIGNSNTMLIELPFDEANVTDRMYETVENLIYDKKFNIILAHPNRYNSYVVENMLSIGVKLQLNISHICVHSERRRIMQWLDRGYVYAVGSDIHRNEKVYEELKRAEKYLGSYIDDINARSTELLKRNFRIGVTI